MPPSSTQPLLLSPAELSYLHTSLSLNPPIRPDARTSTQFRPLIAECDVLPGTNGSARICFADGTEAIVGVKCEVEKSRPTYQAAELGPSEDDDDEEEDEDMREAIEKEKLEKEQKGERDWLELSVEIPGFRDDDSMPVFMAAMLSEALLADAEFVGRLWINLRFHWKIYVDVSFSLYFHSGILIIFNFLIIATTDNHTDFTTFTAIILPTTPPFINNPSRASIYSSSTPQVRR